MPLSWQICYPGNTKYGPPGTYFSERACSPLKYLDSPTTLLQIINYWCCKNDPIVPPPRSLLHHSHPNREGFKSEEICSWSLTGLEFFAKSVGANKNTVMDTARDPEATNDVISPSHWAMLREPQPGDFAWPSLNMALAKCSRVLLPRASSLLVFTTNNQKYAFEFSYLWSSASTIVSYGAFIHFHCQLVFYIVLCQWNFYLYFLLIACCTVL